MRKLKSNYGKEKKGSLIKEFPEKDLEGLYGLAMERFHNADYKRAKEYFLKVCEKGLNIESFTMVAYIYEIEGKHEEAERYYKKAVEKGSIKALESLGDLYFNDYRKREAIEMYSRIPIDNSEGRIILKLGKAYEILDEYEKAEEAYRKALRYYSEEEMAEDFISLYRSMGRFRDVEKWCIRKHNDNIAKAVLEMAYIYEEEGRYTEAEKFYLKALEYGAEKTLLNNMGIISEEMGEYGKAEEYYKRYLSEVHEEPYVLVNLVELYIRTGREDEAEKLLEKFLENGNFEKRNKLYYLPDIARTYEEEGKYEKAEKYYLKSLMVMTEYDILSLDELYKKNNINTEISKEISALSILLQKNEGKFNKYQEKNEHKLSKVIGNMLDKDSGYVKVIQKIRTGLEKYIKEQGNKSLKARK